MDDGVPPDPVEVKEGCQFGSFKLQHCSRGRRLALPGGKSCMKVSGLYVAKRGSDNFSFLHNHFSKSRPKKKFVTRSS